MYFLGILSHFLMHFLTFCKVVKMSKFIRKAPKKMLEFAILEEKYKRHIFLIKG